jgi:hypothetical protein
MSLVASGERWNQGALARKRGERPRVSRSQISVYFVAVEKLLTTTVRERNYPERWPTSGGFARASGRIMRGPGQVSAGRLATGDAGEMRDRRNTPPTKTGCVEGVISSVPHLSVPHLSVPHLSVPHLSPHLSSQFRRYTGTSLWGKKHQPAGLARREDVTAQQEPSSQCSLLLVRGSSCLSDEVRGKVIAMVIFAPEYEGTLGIERC